MGHKFRRTTTVLDIYMRQPKIEGEGLDAVRIPGRHDNRKCMTSGTLEKDKQQRARRRRIGKCFRQIPFPSERCTLTAACTLQG